MPTNTDRLFKAILHFDQAGLPALAKEIVNGHPTANTKDRLLDLHRMLSVVVRYIVLEDAEQHDVKLTPEHAVLPTTPPAQVPVQHFPASANPALGAPPMARAANVTVGPELNLGGGVALGTVMPTIPAEEPDPEPASTIQIVTKRDGSSVVVPPLGSKAPKRVFQAGQGVDATYISKYDAAPSDPTDPDSLGV